MTREKAVRREEEAGPGGRRGRGSRPVAGSARRSRGQGARGARPGESGPRLQIAAVMYPPSRRHGALGRAQHPATWGFGGNGAPRAGSRAPRPVHNRPDLRTAAVFRRSGGRRTRAHGSEVRWMRAAERPAALAGRRGRPSEPAEPATASGRHKKGRPHQRPPLPRLIGGRPERRPPIAYSSSSSLRRRMASSKMRRAPRLARAMQLSRSMLSPVCGSIFQRPSRSSHTSL